MSGSEPPSTAPEPKPRSQRQSPARLVVLLSGRGSNLVALAEACRRGEVPANVALVISDRPDAGGLDRARELGIATAAVDRRLASSREAHEASVREEIERLDPDLICLAGYMRLLSMSFIEAFSMKILNIHPSLLPSFPGVRAQRQALDHGAKVSGCTVHFVDGGLDSGPIVMQQAVEVEEGDDEASLSERILQQEHRIYPAAIRKILVEGWKLEGRKVNFP